MKLFTPIALLLTIFAAQFSNAAYCSLRDPVVAINSLYPLASNHKSIVRTVDQSARVTLSKKMPFTLHHKEIGKHTVYMVLRDMNPLGFVQARSEISEYGLIEIAWAISPDMTIDGMAFQRCRSPKCNEKLRNNVIEKISGMGFKELLSLVSDDGRTFSNSGKELFSSSDPLHMTLLRSAIKTVSVTELLWNDVISGKRKKAEVASLLDTQ